jgi:hypothetical protein
VLTVNKHTAEKVHKLMLDISSQLDESVAFVQKECPVEEFTVYRRAIGNILGEVWDTILRPLYEEHPDLRPRELDDE